MNKGHNALDDLTAETYKVPAGEEKAYHAVIEVEQYNPRTGKRLSVPRIQKFGRKAFEGGLYDTLKKQGYTIRILHDPNEWLKAHAEELAAQKREAAKAAKEAEEKRFKEAVAAEVARQLAATKKSTKKKETE